MRDKDYFAAVEALRNWGRVKRADLERHGPTLDPPPTSKEYRAPNREDPDRPLEPDEEQAERAEQAVRSVKDGFSVVLRNYYIHQLSIYDRATMSEAIRRFWMRYL